MLSLRGRLAALIVAATVVFAAGVTVERNSADEHAEPASGSAIQHAREETKAPGEAGEHSEAEETAGERPGSEATARHTEDEETSEEILGVDTERTPLVVLAVIASLALAAAVVRWRGFAPVLWLAAVAMVAFTALDVREVFHQLDEQRAGLAALAGVVAILHAAAAAIGALQAGRLRGA